MCRLLGFRTNVIRLLEKPLYYMLRASRYDPLIPGAPGGHSHGWGIVLHTYDNILYYRSGNPLYTEPKIIDIITSISGSGLGIAHIRRAGPNEPLGLVHAHPYMGQANDMLVFLAHNGGLLKNEMAALTGYKGDLDNITDTFLYFNYLLGSLAKNNSMEIVDVLLSVVEELISKELVRVKNARGNIVESTLNSLIMLVSNDNVRILVLEDWEHLEDNKRREYYAIYYSKYEDLIVASSNTIYKWLLNEKFKPWNPRPLIEKYIGNHKIRIVEL